MNKLFSQLAIVSLLAGSASAYAAETPSNMTPDQQKQIEKVVHNYLVKNPEVLVESMQTLQQKQMDQARQSMKKTQSDAPRYANALFHQANDPSAGNTAGKVVVVDFFDYQCPHCTSMTPILEQLISGNNELKVVFKEFPIRGALSEFASKAALAAKNQGKYFELHKALIQLSVDQKLSQDSIIEAAKKLGLNVDKLKQDMNGPAVAQQLKDNYKLAQNLQLMGTPAFFIAKANVSANTKADEIVFIPGHANETQLKEVIEKVGK